MRNILTIMNNCRKRSWLIIIICVGLGLLMGVEQGTLGSGFSGDLSKMQVAMVAQEDDVFTQNLYTYLTKDLGMEVVITSNYDDYTNDLLNRDLSAIIEVTPGYYSQCVKNKKALPIETTTLDNYENAAYLKSYLNVYLESMDMIFQSADGNMDMANQLMANLKLPDVEIVGADDAIRERSSNYYGTELTVGFYMNFVWVIGIFVGMMILSDRTDGTLVRIQGSPMKGFQYMIGSCSFFILAGLLVPLIFVGTLVIKNVDVGISYGLLTFLIIIMQVICIGISLIMAMLINSKIGVVVGIYVFGAIIAILGGAYFNLEGITGSLEKVYRLTPVYWVMDCIRSSQSVKDFNPANNIGILCLFAILSILVASALFTRQAGAKE